MNEYKVINFSALGKGVRSDIVKRAIEGLELKVNAEIKGGFIPVGGVSIVIDDSYFVVASQAVIKSPLN